MSQNNKKYELWLIIWFREIVADSAENLKKAKKRFKSHNKEKITSRAAKWMSSVTGLFLASVGLAIIALSLLPKLGGLFIFGGWLIGIGGFFIIARNVMIPVSVVAIGYLLVLLDIVDIFDLLFNSGIIWKIIILGPYFGYEYYRINKKRKAA